MFPIGQSQNLAMGCVESVSGVCASSLPVSARIPYHIKLARASMPLSVLSPLSRVPLPASPYLLHVSPFFQICTNSPSPRMPFQAQFCVSGQYWAGQGWGGGAHRSWWSCGGPDISARVKREGRGSCGCPAKGQQASLEGQNRRHHCA